MRVSLGDFGLPPCQDISQASSTSCVVVPGVTRGTLTTANQGISNVVFGQVVTLNQQAIDAYNANTQAAAAEGSAVIASADPGAIPTPGPASASTPAPTTTAEPAFSGGELAVVAGVIAAVWLVLRTL